MNRVRGLLIVAVASALVACDGMPTPTEVAPVEPSAPSAAVLSRSNAFPFWHRGSFPSSGYVALYFYVQDPTVIPDDFNLLGFFDFRALSADFAVQSIEIRDDPPPATPRKVITTAVSPVTFWFIPSDTWEAATEDGFLGVDELLDTDDVLVGHTTRFGEELHPSGGPAEQVFLHTWAAGTTEDGGSFRFLVSLHFNDVTGEIDGILNMTLDID